MQNPIGGRDDAEPRLDVHNPNVDQSSAAADLCGVIDLRNGRVCTKPALHSGGCDFEAPAEKPAP